MANVTLPGTGAVVATEEVAGAQVQIVKLTDSTVDTGLTQPLTDIQIRATPLPVSGTVTVNVGLTDTEIRATALPVSLAADGDGANATVKVLTNGGGFYDQLYSDGDGNLKVAISTAISITGGLITYDGTGAIYDVGDVQLTPIFALISASSSDNNTVVAAVASRKIRVLALSLSASGAVNGKFQSGASGTDKTGLYYLTTNTVIVLPYNKLGWFETASGALLNLNLSGAVPVGGCLTYIEVP